MLDGEGKYKLDEKEMTIGRLEVEGGLGQTEGRNGG